MAFFLHHRDMNRCDTRCRHPNWSLGLTAVSLLLNIVLLWFVFTESPNSELETVAVADPLTNGVQADPLARSTPLDELKVIQPESATPFTWAGVESKDYKQYVANLRSIGCPEQLIRDLIHAELAQSYASRAAEIWPQTPSRYWDKLQPAQPDHGQTEQLMAIARERETLFKELFGISASSQEPIDVLLLQVHGTRHEMAFLPASQRQAARDALLAAGIDEASMFLARQGRASEQSQFEKKLSVLATVLSTDELQEYRLRHSPAAGSLRAELRYFDCTAEEFKRFLELRERADGRGTDSLIDRSRAVEQFRTEFGEDRVEEFARVTDLLYINARRGAEEHGVPVDRVEEAWAVIREGRKRIEAARQSELAAISADTVRQVEQILGPQAARAVVRDIKVIFGSSRQGAPP